MLEGVVVIVLVKQGLILFELWTVGLQTYFAESSKNCEQQSLPQ